MREETTLNKKKRAVDKAFKKSRKKNYSCFCPGCHEKAIRSHSQSKSSSLRSIQNIGKVVTKDFLFFPENSIVKWKETSLKKVSTFPGFCTKHDDMLFKKVDSMTETNISSKSLAYLAFRTFAMEMRKKEYHANVIDLILSNINEETNTDGTGFLNNPSDGFKNCLTITKPFYLAFFETLLSTSKEPKMVHKIFKLELNLGVSCSTIINPIPILDLPINKPQPLIAFNILPRKDYTLVTFSSPECDLVLMNNFISSNRRLENLIFNFCEEIAINPTFFHKIPPLILAAIDQALQPWDIWEERAIPNLFDIELSNDFIWKIPNAS